jgi:hypothetical protein
MPQPRLYRNALSPPDLTPKDLSDPETKNTPNLQTNRVVFLPLAPGFNQEHRINEADRAAPSANFTPAVSYADTDKQKGDAPGSMGSVITTQSPDGVTTVGHAPESPRHLSYGWSDYSGYWPTFVGAHLKINWAANPNRPQVNPTPFNNEGPSSNTRYATPSPFAQGVFIG